MLERKFLAMAGGIVLIFMIGCSSQAPVSGSKGLKKKQVNNTDDTSESTDSGTATKNTIDNTTQQTSDNTTQQTSDNATQQTSDNSKVETSPKCIPMVSSSSSAETNKDVINKFYYPIYPIFSQPLSDGDKYTRDNVYGQSISNSTTTNTQSDFVPQATIVKSILNKTFSKIGNWAVRDFDDISKIYAWNDTDKSFHTTPSSTNNTVFWFRDFAETYQYRRLICNDPATSASYAPPKYFEFGKSIGGKTCIVKNTSASLPGDFIENFCAYERDQSTSQDQSQVTTNMALLTAALNDTSLDSSLRESIKNGMFPRCDAPMVVNISDLSKFWILDKDSTGKVTANYMEFIGDSTHISYNDSSAFGVYFTKNEFSSADLANIIRQRIAVIRDRRKLFCDVIDNPSASVSVFPESSP